MCGFWFSFCCCSSCNYLHSIKSKDILAFLTLIQNTAISILTIAMLFYILWKWMIKMFSFTLAKLAITYKCHSLLSLNYLLLWNNLGRDMETGVGPSQIVAFGWLLLFRFLDIYCLVSFILLILLDAPEMLLNAPKNTSVCLPVCNLGGLCNWR